MVYADSLAAISADKFPLLGQQDYPNVRQDFEKSFATLSRFPCDILLTPHPEISDMWERLAKRDKGGDPNAFVDTTRASASPTRLARTREAPRKKRAGKPQSRLPVELKARQASQAPLSDQHHGERQHRQSHQRIQHPPCARPRENRRKQPGAKP